MLEQEFRFYRLRKRVKGGIEIEINAYPESQTVLPSATPLEVSSALEPAEQEAVFASAWRARQYSRQSEYGGHGRPHVSATDPLDDARIKVPHSSERVERRGTKAFATVWK